MKGATQVRVLATRIPVDARPRLTRLARRGGEVCRKHRAPLLAEICIALEIALMDLAAAEIRAASLLDRARRAEEDNAELRLRIVGLQEDAVQEDFNVPTRTRTDPALIRQCRKR